MAAEWTALALPRSRMRQTGSMEEFAIYFPHRRSFNVPEGMEGPSKARATFGGGATSRKTWITMERGYQGAGTGVGGNQPTDNDGSDAASVGGSDWRDSGHQARNRQRLHRPPLGSFAAPVVAGSCRRIGMASQSLNGEDILPGVEQRSHEGPPQIVRREGVGTRLLLSAPQNVRNRFAAEPRDADFPSLRDRTEQRPGFLAAVSEPSF